MFAFSCKIKQKEAMNFQLTNCKESNLVEEVPDWSILM